MNADEIRAFVQCDWAAVADSKAGFWAARKRIMTAGESLAVADTLRRHVRVLRPDWPGSLDRDEDLAVHERVSEALRAVSPVRDQPGGPDRHQDPRRP